MRPQPSPNPIHNTVSTIAQQAPTTPLFEGDDQLFRQEVTACSVYGEYVCGSSTI
jgi:hypothetical protein